ncbi:DUF6270 domain-containing protein [Bacillus cereus]|uniref:DUF6270 domain-containing protein n=1 Tax=Bacillus TaxID=1386 RepID=UPI000BFE3C24|nr:MULTISPECIES: DUF6270 domain-containing protein [Bacillus]MDA1580245.1 DUF6270 domain-containing protein [Bacillus cereus group sp. TH228LC]MEC3470110.1 DUF6270 domain-containing protein [Bacillus tropicus]PGS94896.1 hypothetical protein COC98_23620 [Bacillus anthracis]PHA15351.1 hypothetical protein COE65_04140 [Bacillus sp. AFS051223]
MIKIAVLGSCVSRDSFNSKFISDYKNYYTCVLHQNQMSMISLASDVIQFKEELLDNLKPFDKKHFKSELNKEFIREIVTEQPEYLIIDFYGDVFYGVQRIGESFITNKKWLFSKTNQYKELDKGEELQLFKQPTEFFELWKKGIEFLFDLLQEKVPNCKVIINKARFVDEYIDQNSGEIKSISKSGKHKQINVSLYNKWWETLDNYVINRYKVYSIDYGEAVYRAVEDHPWGMFYVHYNQEFYHDFTRKLMGIIIQDLQNEKNQENAIDENIKLLIDYKNKISGNTITNPHYTAYRGQISKLGNPYTDFSGESWTATYDSISSLDGNLVLSSTDKKGTIGQRIFSFNLVAEIENKCGPIPSSNKIEWIKNRLLKLSCNWWGNGSHPGGKGAILTNWIVSSSSWNTSGVEKKDCDYSVQLNLYKDYPNKAINISDNIDSKGFIHFLTYANQSDGDIASSVSTDYISVELELESE